MNRTWAVRFVDVMVGSLVTLAVVAALLMAATDSHAEVRNQDSRGDVRGSTERQADGAAAADLARLLDQPVDGVIR